jgi:hypothetical protein
MTFEFDLFYQKMAFSGGRLCPKSHCFQELTGFHLVLNNALSNSDLRGKIYVFEKKFLFAINLQNVLRVC